MAREFKSGIAFKNDKLYLFDKQGVTVCNSWPNLRAWRKTRCRRWRHLRPRLENSYISLSHPSESQLVEQQGKMWPEQKWVRSIPAHVLEAVEPFKYRQWHLLCLIARCGQSALDLARSTPALAWMLASSWAFKEKPVQNHFRSIRNLFKKGCSQREILAWLDYPSSKSVIRQLRKLDLFELDVTMLLNLKQRLNTPDICKLICHYPRISKDVLWLTSPKISDYLRFHPHFFQEYANLKVQQKAPYSAVRNVISFSDVCITIEDTLHIAKQRQRGTKMIKSIEQLTHYHDTLTRHFNARTTYHDDFDNSADEDLATVHDEAFPWFFTDLPEGYSQVEFIDSKLKLLREGVEMHHCVGTYVSDALSQRSFFFSIRGTTRATLQIRWSQKTREWEAYQLKSYLNKDVDTETKILVLNWLADLNDIYCSSRSWNSV